MKCTVGVMSPKLRTVEITHPAETPKGETTVRRNIFSQYALTETPHPDVRTIYDLVQFNALRWGDNPCFGTRRVIKIHTDAQTGGKMPRMSWELGPYQYQSYEQVAQEGLHLGYGLRKMGLENGDKVAIYADTSYFPILFSLIQGTLAVNGSGYTYTGMN
jgi:long-chain acyl-CoA synthetase